MKIFLYKRLCVIFLLTLAFVITGCEGSSSGVDQNVSQNFPAESSIESLPPLTPEYAAEIAERLLREQADPAYQEALSVHARRDYEVAEKLFKPLVDADNTMAMVYYAVCLRINYEIAAYNESSDLLIKAAVRGNPFAMWRLNRIGISLGTYSRISDESWSDRMVEYWRIRSEAGDAEAMFCLSRALENGSYYLAKAAYFGHPAALFSFDIKEEFEKFSEFYSVHPEMSGWGDVVLGKLKELADAGNPVAQCNYGTITDNEAYWEKSAENFYLQALGKLAQKHTDKRGFGKKDIQKGVYYTVLAELIRYKSFTYDPHARYLRYDNPNGGLRLSLTEEELNQIKEKAQKWYDEKGCPAPYVYLHPLIRFGPR